jgi:hypothetical protein
MPYRLSNVNPILTTTQLRKLLSKEGSYQRIVAIIADTVLEQTNDKELASRVRDKLLDPSFATFDPPFRLIRRLCITISHFNGQIADYKKAQAQRNLEVDDVIILKPITQYVFPELDDEGINIVTHLVLRSSKRYTRQIIERGKVETYRKELVRIRKYVDRARGCQDQNRLFAGSINELFHRDNSPLSLSNKINNFAAAVKILNEIAWLVPRALATTQ